MDDADVEKDELRVQVSTLRYELENIRQERDLQTLRFEKETRDLQLKWDADFRKAQVSLSENPHSILKLILLGCRVCDQSCEPESRNLRQRIERSAGTSSG